MRLLATIAVAGSLLSIADLQAQSLAEHGAAAAGATIGTAAGKPLSGAITKIFGDTDNEVKSVNRGTTKPVTRTSPPAETLAPAGSPPNAAAAGSGDVGPSGSSGGSGTSSSGAAEGSHRIAVRRRRPAEATAVLQPLAPIAPVAIVEPPAPKQPTVQEVAGIQVGASEQDVISALGTPASRVTIPDDDGHLRESFQFWANGTQLGTIRLDNGSVVSVEARHF